MLGRAAASRNRKCYEAADGHSQSCADTYERGSLGRFPVDNCSRAFNSEERRQETQMNTTAPNARRVLGARETGATTISKSPMPIRRAAIA